MREELIFYERQYFNRRLAVLIIVIINALFIYGCIVQIGMGKPWGDNPMSNTTLIIITASTMLLSASFFFIRLDTIINEEGIYIRGFPFFLKHSFFSWDIISKAYIRIYNPILEYGGWGIRRRRRPRFNFFKIKRINIRKLRNSNIAYNMSGNIGLQLELIDGKRVLIGTCMPDEMEDVIRKLGKWQE